LRGSGFTDRPVLLEARSHIYSLLCKLQTGRRQFLNLFIDKVEAKGERRSIKPALVCRSRVLRRGDHLGR
jgi:hypothetical protein